MCSCRIVRIGSGGHQHLTHSGILALRRGIVAGVLWAVRQPGWCLVPADLAWGILCHLMGGVVTSGGVERRYLRFNRRYRLLPQMVARHGELLHHGSSRPGWWRVDLVVGKGLCVMGCRLYRTGLLLVGLVLLLTGGMAAGLGSLLPAPTPSYGTTAPLPVGEATSGVEAVPSPAVPTPIPAFPTAAPRASSRSGVGRSLVDEHLPMLLVISASGVLLLLVWRMTRRRRRMPSLNQTMQQFVAAGDPATQAANARVIAALAAQGTALPPALVRAAQSGCAWGGGGNGRHHTPPALAAQPLPSDATTLAAAPRWYRTALPPLDMVSPRSQRIQIASLLAQTLDVQIDGIVRQTGLPRQSIEPILLEMQIDGLVVQDGLGDSYRVCMGQAPWLLAWAMGEMMPADDQPASTRVPTDQHTPDPGAPPVVDGESDSRTDLLPAPSVSLSPDTPTPDCAGMAPGGCDPDVAAVTGDALPCGGEVDETEGGEPLPDHPNHSGTDAAEQLAEQPDQPDHTRIDDMHTFFGAGAISLHDLSENRLPSPAAALPDVEPPESGDCPLIAAHDQVALLPLDDLHAVLEALVTDPHINAGDHPGVSPRRVRALLPPPWNGVARDVLAWLDAAGVLEAAPDVDQPWRTPRPLRLTDVAAITAALAQTPMPMPDGAP